ncbi:hypothetical protein NE865_12916 [Phthorimaea operculella]|nr:hypothetical protein NE865_12916 [Phthorimaea operculella]
MGARRSQLTGGRRYVSVDLREKDHRYQLKPSRLILKSKIFQQRTRRIKCSGSVDKVIFYDKIYTSKMRQSATFILLAVMVTQIYGAPQLISFKDGRIGVNFAGYHASAGLGGLVGDGASGGLFAEAGTPFGQSARAGLGGSVDGNGGPRGGLYAGATAGGNVKASAGLGGEVTGEKSSGSGFATAQAGDKVASSGLGGGASVEGASGFSFAGTKSYGVSKGVVKEVEVAPPVQQAEIHKDIDVDVKFDAANEVKPLPLTPVKVESKTAVSAEAPTTVVVKEIHPEPAPAVVQKEVYHSYRRIKPHRHHLHKTAYIGGYIGSDGGFAVPAPPPPPPQVVYRTKYVPVQPVIEKRVDVGVESAAHAGANAHADVGGSGGGQFGYTKQVTYQRNPQFFADIFNIPISTLRAVGNFLGNAAGSTSVSVQKTASIQAEDNISSKHAPSSSAASTDTQISVQTPNVSSFIDDIFSIPINTLGAVNKFLENNVARKNVQVSVDGDPTKVRLGPHARRRANKRVVVVQEASAAEPAGPEPRPSEQ